MYNILLPTKMYFPLPSQIIFQNQIPVIITVHTSELTSPVFVPPLFIINLFPLHFPEAQHG